MSFSYNTSNALAPYALQDGEHGGRIYQEQQKEEDSYRTPFQRDRDRIIHSKAFRRLGYKTQVFSNSAGDIYRTRLTHSLEVAQISRAISRALGLNQDLAEALALAHDLGHSPFAHAGQKILHGLMREHGGFEHNCQGLRQLCKLEDRYLDFPGLNLCRKTLAGMMKHGRVYGCDPELSSILADSLDMPPIFEARLVDICDRIAYLHHDLEDGLDAKLLVLADLEAFAWWQEAFENIQAKKGRSLLEARPARRIRAIIHYMLTASINNVLQHSRQNLQTYQRSFSHREGAKQSSDKGLHSSSSKYPGMGNLLSTDAALSKRLDSLQKYLHENLYMHPKVIQMSEQGAHIIESLFVFFAKHREEIPAHYLERVPQDGLYRTVTDYLAGMTDRFAEKLYSQYHTKQIYSFPE